MVRTGTGWCKVCNGCYFPTEMLEEFSSGLERTAYHTAANLSTENLILNCIPVHPNTFLLIGKAIQRKICLKQSRFIKI